ncbi:transcriptional regulator [Chryseobacterium sp. 6424]|uniref:helix-turn-helix transcriptional regulator n=1 Tax=Chryseobacterium sp. 6424 TaxID=2039166 RepID=UPI000EFD22F6|nr:helix-turn-helix transcriptional regulator [Chryseobacterium sp. 6424]AYO57540.1 transcriptional regulator [Chryseobacterium sp. 6424]
MNLNERIAEIIAYSKLTPSEFADEIEVQRSNISHITSGRNKPSLDFLIKIKNRFPELTWDWVITGEGEMLQKPEEKIPAKTQSVPVPDLFSIITDENFGKTSDEQLSETVSPRESDIPAQRSVKEILSDSQRLGNQELKPVTQTTENQLPIIKKIVWFYDNGKFESFEP